MFRRLIFSGHKVCVHIFSIHENGHFATAPDVKKILSASYTNAVFQAEEYDMLCRNETEMEKAVSVLQGYTWKNKQIKVKVR